MAGYQISICNYEFSIAWKTPTGKIRRETVVQSLRSLIGEDKNEILLDPTGYNQNAMRRIYARMNKGKEINLEIYSFRIVWVDVVKHHGKTMWIEKKK